MGNLEPKLQKVAVATFLENKRLQELISTTTKYNDAVSNLEKDIAIKNVRVNEGEDAAKNIRQRALEFGSERMGDYVAGLETPPLKH